MRSANVRAWLIGAVLVVCSAVGYAQNLTPSQKEQDFRFLASLYSTYYAPLDWKKQLFGVDALNIGQWLERVGKTTTDLEFYELCIEYVASLNDAHSSFSLPSDFVARLGFSADIYDGVVLIDGVDRRALPQSTYPFVVGDEVISVDGQEAMQLVRQFTKYIPWGHPAGAQRMAAAMIGTRQQAVMPYAVNVGNSATVIIRRQSGSTETYTIPWVKTGTPITVGPVPSPARSGVKMASKAALGYMDELEKATFSGILSGPATGVLGFGSRTPIFVAALPAFRFTRRLGGNSADFFYSGTFSFEGMTLGYLRVPNFSPPSASAALLQLESEIAYMNTNTDGLIVDEMRNTGGNLCIGEEFAARLIPYQFQATGFQLRPYWSRVVGFYNSMISAKANGASQEVIERYEMLYKEMATANQQGRLVTRTLPLCSSSLIREPLRDRSGNAIAYQKPIMLLIDNFTTSTGDSLAAMLQDSQRALLYGMRTAGAGGNNTLIDGGPYTEGVLGMTLALQVRRNFVGTLGYPVTNYIENVGVHPDFEANYMTKENLLQGGAPFLSGVLYHMVAYVRQRPR